MKNNKGFSLVELIVVIAIMAILAAVAVIGVSVYIPKAQQASDKQMVGDIEYALELHAQSTPEDVAAGYIILTPTGAQATEGFVTDVLIATYGEDWANELKLAYGEWTNEGMLDLVTNYTQADLELIAGSSFMNSSTEGILNAVTGMTGLVGDVIDSRSENAAESRGHLVRIFGEDSDIVAKLDDLQANEGLTDAEYSTAVSNLLVGTMADAIGDNPAMQTMINMYAAAYNYAEETGDTSALEQMERNLSNLDLDVLVSGENSTPEEEAQRGFAAITEGISDDEDNPCKGFAAYMSSESGSDKIASDNEALGTMMGAVKEIANDFQDKDSLTNAELFSSNGVANQVNGYLDSVKALAGMDATEIQALQNLEAGSIVVLVTVGGNVSVVPGMN